MPLLTCSSARCPPPTTQLPLLPSYFRLVVAETNVRQVNPSGRLSVTLPNQENEVGFTPAQFPGVGRPPEATYSEELLVGYR